MDQEGKQISKGSTDTESERNLRLHAEESMREALNRVDDILARLGVFQGSVASALAIDNGEDLVEHSLETVVETYETELFIDVVLSSDIKRRRL